MTEPEICPVCKNPKVSNHQGSFTQWIQACTCDIPTRDIEDIDKLAPINICRQCGKRTNEGRLGSITQFIFRSDSCQCERPNIANSIFDTNPPIQSVTVKLEAEEDVEYKTKIDDFPYDRFTPLEKLGEGANGAIYLARDKLLNVKVAVKILHSLEQKQLIAFHEEAKATNKLTHPAIVKVMDFGDSPTGIPYMVLEYVPGFSLESLLKIERCLEWQTCVHIFQQILEAISYAHANGVYHRDIKPSNVLLIEHSPNNLLVKIIDFGIAKVIETEKEDSNKQLVGTPLYMSPDQAKGKSYDARSELYSIGCMLFECITGRPPFTGTSALDTLSLHAREPIPSVNDFLKEKLPPQVDLIVGKALDKEKENRFQTATEFHSAITNIDLNPEPVVVSTESAPSLMRTKFFSMLLAVLLMTIFPLVLITGLPILLGKDSIEAMFWEVDRYKSEPIENKNELITTIGKVDPALDIPIWRKTKHLVKGFNITDDSFKLLAKKYPKTKNIRVMYPSDIFGYGLEFVTNKRYVEVISIASTQFNEQGAKTLTQFKRVRDLKIIFSENLTDKSIEYIVSMPKLRTLELRNLNPLPPNTISILSNSKTLRKIDFKSSKQIKLKELYKFQIMPKLQSLKLNNSELSDLDVPSLLKLHVGDLGLENTKISNMGLMQLTKLKSLRSIEVSITNDKVTLIGVRKFLSARPDCKLTVFDKKGNLINLNNPVFTPVDRALEDLKDREHDF